MESVGNTRGKEHGKSAGERDKGCGLNMGWCWDERVWCGEGTTIGEGGAEWGRVGAGRV